MKKNKFNLFKKSVCIFLLLSLAFSGISVFADEEQAPEQKNESYVKPFVYFHEKPMCEFAGIESPEIHGKYAVAVNADTGSIMYCKNQNVLAFPASTVKIMTAIVAYENIPDLETEIMASENAVKISRGTRLNPLQPIKAGEKFTARQLMYAMLMNGANDAANVLAEHVGGSVAKFCEMMNDKAKEIGAVNTVFKNPTGLHEEGMVTTAYDMALIANYAYFINEITEMASTANYTIDKTEKTDTSRYIINRNRMILRLEGQKNYFYKGSRGLSSGSTPQGGVCIVAAAKRNGLTYIVVVLDSEETDSENFGYSDAESILDMCFNEFSMQEVISKNKIACEVPVGLSSSTDYATLFPKESVSALLPNNIDTGADLKYEKLIYKDANAPIRQGDEFGDYVAVFKDDIVLGRTKLVSGTDIERSNILYIMHRITNFLKSRWFKAAAVSAVVIFIIYCVAYARARKKRRNYRR